MTQTLIKQNWLNQNELIRSISTLVEIPKHRVYVDVLGNGGAYLLQKQKSKLEVFNDSNKELLSFLLAARSNPQGMSQYDLLRLRNTMIECVDVERLLGIYDGPETVFYIDFIHQVLSLQEQTDILMQLALLKGNVILVVSSDVVLPQWSKTIVSNGIHILTNFYNEQMSLFATFPSMEGVVNHD